MRYLKHKFDDGGILTDASNKPEYNPYKYTYDNQYGAPVRLEEIPDILDDQYAFGVKTLQEHPELMYYGDDREAFIDRIVDMKNHNTHLKAQKRTLPVRVPYTATDEEGNQYTSDEVLRFFEEQGYKNPQLWASGYNCISTYFDSMNPQKKGKGADSFLFDNHSVTGNQTFAKDPESFGFKKIGSKKDIDMGSLRNGDMIQYLVDGVPYHAAEYSGEGQDYGNDKDPVVSYSDGHEDFKKNVHFYPSDYNVYRFTGTSKDRERIGQFYDKYGVQQNAANQAVANSSKRPFLDVSDLDRRIKDVHLKKRGGRIDINRLKFI